VSALENDRYGYYNRTEEELEEELDTILNVENKCLRWNVIWVLMFAIILLFLPFWLFLLLLPLSREVSTSVPSINSAVAFLALMVVNLWCALVLMYATIHVVLTMRTLMKYTRMSNVEEWERYELQERQGWPLRCFTVCSWRIWKGLCCWVCNLRKDDALTEPLLQDDHEADLEQRRPAHPRLAQQYCGAGGDHTKLRERLRHVVVMVSYKEPLALMERTLDSVASQTIAQQIIMVVAFEEREGKEALDAKERALRARYGFASPFNNESGFDSSDHTHDGKTFVSTGTDAAFAGILFTRHPKAVAPWEVPGKCSNVNFAFRRVASLIYAQRSQEHQGYPGHGDQHVVDDTVFENFTGTSCDADSVFHPQYFEWLGYKFVALRHEQHQHPRNHTSMIDKNYHRNGSGPLGDKEGPEQSCRHRKQNLPPLRGPHAVIFQAPIFYNFHLHRAIFFVRVTGLMRSFFMQGLLIPQSINVMSIFSFSMRLCVRAGFFHPRYHFDDNIYALSCMVAVGRRIRLMRVPFAVISGPTSGDSIWANLAEWEKQARRWTVGACDNFHYFVSNFHRFRSSQWTSFWAGLRYAVAFTHYYAFVLGIMCLVPVSSIVFSAAHLDGAQAQQLERIFGLSDHVAHSVTRWALPASLLFQYAICGAMFLADAAAVRWVLVTFVDKERVGLLRNLLHWLLSWPTMLCYNAVTYVAMWRALASRGGHLGNHTIKDSLHAQQRPWDRREAD